MQVRKASKANKLLFPLLFYRNIYKLAPVNSNSLYEIITKEIFTVKDTGIRYNNINYWDSIGILDAQQQGAGWRNFTFAGYLWLHTVDELRAIGLPAKLIKKVKDKVYSGKLPAFLSLVADAINREPVMLLIFQDGSYKVKEQEEQTEQTHVAVSVNRLIKKFLSDKKGVPFLTELPLVEPNEANLLGLLHAGQYDTITIKVDGKKAVELKKGRDTVSTVVSVIYDRSYKEIELRNKGMLTKIEGSYSNEGAKRRNRG